MYDVLHDYLFENENKYHAVHNKKKLYGPPRACRFMMVEVGLPSLPSSVWIMYYYCLILKAVNNNK